MMFSIFRRSLINCKFIVNNKQSPHDDEVKQGHCSK